MIRGREIHHANNGSKLDIWTSGHGACDDSRESSPLMSHVGRNSLPLIIIRKILQRGAYNLLNFALYAEIHVNETLKCMKHVVQKAVTVL